MAIIRRARGVRIPLPSGTLIGRVRGTGQAQTVELVDVARAMVATGQVVGSAAAPSVVAAGTGIGVAYAAPTYTVSNTGVLSNLAGSGISVSGATGNVTVSNTGVLSVTGTVNRLTASAATGAITLDISASYIGQNTITTLGTVATGSWQAGIVAGQYGGTGVANTGKTITLGGNLTVSGAFATTITVTATTNSTLPAGTHTLAGLDVAQTFTAAQTFNSGGTNSTLICTDSGAATYNIISLNGATANTSAIGLLGGGSVDNNLYILVPSTGKHKLRVSGTDVITFQNTGSVDFSATGGSNQVVKQLTAGGAFTVATLNYTELAGAFASQQQTLSNKTTTSLSAVMAGFAGSFTPTLTGKALIFIVGVFENSVVNDGAAIQLRYGTGTAPTNGAADTGTAVGAVVSAFFDGSNVADPYTLVAKVTGLTVNTAYWIDGAIQAITGGTATFTGALTVVEIP